MENGYTVYKIYPDGSGEQIAWFQYPGICAKFIHSLSIEDFITFVGEGDSIIILTISDSHRELCGDLTRQITKE